MMIEFANLYRVWGKAPGDMQKYELVAKGGFALKQIQVGELLVCFPRGEEPNGDQLVKDPETPTP